jgi:hypothetical protein
VASVLKPAVYRHERREAASVIALMISTGI